MAGGWIVARAFAQVKLPARTPPGIGPGHAGTTQRPAPAGYFTILRVGPFFGGGVSGGGSPPSAFLEGSGKEMP